MAKNSEDVLSEIKVCIQAGRSFALEAGAGSGKTQTLVNTLKYLLEVHSDLYTKNNRKIVCITYTNVAKEEIEKRIDNNPLVMVNTIHGFLWSIVKHYQRELRQVITERNQLLFEEEEIDLSEIQIEYSLYGTELSLGKISHDEVILYSLLVFEKFKKLSLISANRFPFILVDEYQDTDPQMVRLLVDHLIPDSGNKVVVGFFGDSMQQIYDKGIGKIKSDRISQITKFENYRCSLQVIELLNRIRTDLKQKPGTENVEGSVYCFYTNDSANNSRENYDQLRKYLAEKCGWNFESKQTKILILTHMGIARMLGYENLFKAYNELEFGRDKFFNKQEVFSKIIMDGIEPLVHFYEEKKYGLMMPLLGHDGVRITSQADKKRIDDLMKSLIELRLKGTIKQVLDYAISSKLILEPKELNEFYSRIDDPEYDTESEFWDLLKNVNYSEIIAVNKYIDDNTPFSTKHGVKGAEFDDVLVVIEDGSWFKYSFDDVFAGKHVNQNRFNQTQNLLYVCCSRAKNRLALLALSDLSSEAIRTLESWLPKKHLVHIDEIATSY